MWVDENYKDPISEYYTDTDSPDKLPERNRYITPTYPEAATRAAAEGSVWLKVLIDEKGKVRAARVLEDSGLDVGFEDAALSAARRSTWKPAFKDGKRVPIWVTYEAAFYLTTTAEGLPIRHIDRWRWRVRGAYPSLDTPLDTTKSASAEMPDPTSFIQIDQSPAKVKEGKIIYPVYALKAGIEGSVWVKVLVNKAGQVVEAMVVKESGYNCGFEESALWGAIGCKWKPAMQDGMPINLWVTYEIAFRIRGK